MSPEPGTRVRTPAGIGIIECEVPGTHPLWIVRYPNGERLAWRPAQIAELESEQQQSLFTEEPLAPHQRRDARGKHRAA